MKQAFRLSAACAALFWGIARLPADVAEAATPVLAQDLAQVRASGRVLGAQWTRRERAYTLQIVFPDPLSHAFGPRPSTMKGGQTIAAPNATSGTPSSPVVSSHEQIEATQVWLLAADGTVIRPISRIPEKAALQKVPNIRYLGQTPLELQYNFPLDASHDAVALAIMLDGKVYIDRLVPFENPGQ